MKILHVIKTKDHALAAATVRDQAGLLSASENLTVLLIHDAVLTTEDSLKELGAGANVSVIMLKDDAAARGVNPPYPTVDYNGMLELIFDSEKVICW
jgi:sulfur relay protein TusB/DsrH